ncbi:MAG: hypothetical protein RI980_824 [Bacteroidota bacterium]|jgi:hypothetical protein
MINFEPYVGGTYFNKKTKILVLGESHYFNEEDLKSFLNDAGKMRNVTKNVLDDYKNYKLGYVKYAKWMNTFTKFCNVFTDRKNSNVELIEFWNKVSFYNYVQFPTRGPRQSPTKEEFEISFSAFTDVLKELEPDIIYIWGKRLWNNIQKESLIKLDEIDYLNLHKKIPVHVVFHPSSTKFNYTSSKAIKDYFERVFN